MPFGKRRTPRPQRNARPVLWIYRFKERQGLTATRSMTQVHAACRDSKWAQLCTRNWQPAGPVWLNPETEISASEIRGAA
jgi:hypothetical protein